MTVTADGVTLNRRYADVTHLGGVGALHLPAGFWAVKLRQRGDQWIAFAVPRLDTQGDPFHIAVGDGHDAVRGAAIRWTSGAKTLVMRLDRITYAGTGDATCERLTADEQAAWLAALDTRRHR